ncbi:MAG: CBS domain-containing protein [Flavisolibacter sp.]|nr:CBS domain-containing protein [Flavisolibacter sp.]
MKKVSDILNRKGTKMISVLPATTVLDSLRIMADKNIGSVMVIEENKYLGLITERDYSRKIVLKERSSTDTLVSEIMSTDLPHVKTSDTIEFCMQLMSDKNVRYLPVAENGEVIGIISINDVVKETILAQQETINNLQSYLYSNS